MLLALALVVLVGFLPWIRLLGLRAILGEMGSTAAIETSIVTVPAIELWGIWPWAKLLRLLKDWRSESSLLLRRPIQSRVLRNGHGGTALLNSILRKLSSLVPGWFWVVENTKRIPQNPRKALPVQAISMSISIIIPEDTRKVRHLNQKDSNVSYMIISRLLK